MLLSWLFLPSLAAALPYLLGPRLLGLRDIDPGQGGHEVANVAQGAVEFCLEKERGDEIQLFRLLPPPPLFFFPPKPFLSPARERDELLL